MHERLGFDTSRIKSLTLPSARVTAPDAAHRVGIKPEDRRWLGRWQAPADQSMTDVHSRQQFKVVVGIWQQLVAQWPESSIGELSPLPLPVCLTGPGSGLELDGDVHLVHQQARKAAVPSSMDANVAKRGKTLQNSGHDVQALTARQQLWAAAMSAKQRFGIRFVLNTFSKKLHAVDVAETRDITRGCRWWFSQDKVLELPNLDDICGVPATPCVVCLPSAGVAAELLSLAKKNAEEEDCATTCVEQPSINDAGSDSEQEVAGAPGRLETLTSTCVLACTLQTDT